MENAAEMERRVEKSEKSGVDWGIAGMRDFGGDKRVKNERNGAEMAENWVVLREAPRVEMGMFWAKYGFGDVILFTTSIIILVVNSIIF